MRRRDHVEPNDPKVARVAEVHAKDDIERAIAEAIVEAKKEMKKEMHNLIDVEDITTIKLYTNARIIRCLVDSWVKSGEGKEALRLMNNITKSRDILRDIKTCIQHDNDEKLHQISIAIDNVATLPGGQGLVDLMVGYLQAYFVTRKKLSATELSVIQDKVASSYKYGLGEALMQWLTLIMTDLMSENSAS